MNSLLKEFERIEKMYSDLYGLNNYLNAQQTVNACFSQICDFYGDAAAMYWMDNSNLPQIAQNLYYIEAELQNKARKEFNLKIDKEIE